MIRLNLIREFVRKNPIVFYSLFLIVAITLTFFFYAYYSISEFQTSTDSLLQSKAVLAEKVFDTLAGDVLSDPTTLQSKIGNVQKQNNDVSYVAVFRYNHDANNFRALASTDPTDMSDGGKTVNDQISFLAWNSDRPIAYIGHDSQGRYWNVVRKTGESAGSAQGLIVFRLSLADHDAFIRDTLFHVYMAVIVALLFILLLIGNHLRLFQYSFRVAKLEEIDQMKDDFISMASHELKSPLTVIRGYVELLGDSLKSKEAKNPGDDFSDDKKFLANIDGSVERLNGLIEDILNVSRLEQNRLPIDMGRVEVAPMVAAIAVQYEVLAKEKGLSLICEESIVSDVDADPERMKQVLVNILSNAVKYTVKGEIRIRMKENRDGIHITVADTGLGMSAAAMEHLFAKFYRVRTDETARISGTGLGLWISREIARKMNGDLSAESIEGVGSHFTLTLKKYEEK